MEYIQINGLLLNYYRFHCIFPSGFVLDLLPIRILTPIFFYSYEKFSLKIKTIGNSENSVGVVVGEFGDSFMRMQRHSKLTKTKQLRCDGTVELSRFKPSRVDRCATQESANTPAWSRAGNPEPETIYSYSSHCTDGRCLSQLAIPSVQQRACPFCLKALESRHFQVLVLEWPRTCKPPGHSGSEYFEQQ